MKPQNPQSLLEQLHDIEGLDAISAWPFAIGWMLLIIAAIFLVSLISTFVVYWIAYKRSWRNDTIQKLALLEQNLSEATSRETVITLSEYLRRIVLRRYSRRECAGLSGDVWLKWLSTNDPKQFDWQHEGTLLIEGPYAPTNKSYSSEKIKELIKAVRNWVR